MRLLGISKADWKGTVLPGALALLAVFALQIAGFAPLARAGQLIFDSYIRAQPRSYESAPIRVVDIDEESLHRYGQWPWPRTQIAELTRKLGEAGAAAIALDIVFAEPDRTSPPRIAQSLRGAPGSEAAVASLSRLPDSDAQLAAAWADLPVVTGFFLTGDAFRSQAVPKAGFAISGSPPGDAVPAFANAVQPLPALVTAATGNGSVTLAGDSDGIIRKAPLLFRQKDQLLPSLSVEALRVAQGAGAIVVKTSDGSGSLGAGRSESDVLSLKVGDFEVPTTESGALWMYYTRPQPDRVVPAWQILSGALTPAQLEQRFGGQITFVGAGAVGLRDLVSTPLQERELGVMIHAQAAEQMILGQFLTRPDWALGLERTLMLGLGGALLLLLPRLGAALGAGLGTVFAGGTVAGSWYAFSAGHFLLDPTYPVLAVLTVYVAQTGFSYYREEQRRRYIHRAFDRYLSPELVKRIAANPAQLELGGEEREMTVLFCDIRSFSRISEQFRPNEIIRLLISFLTPMCDVLLRRKATIDKFMGDAILAFWNAPLDDPDQYQNAARAALDMIAELEELNRAMAGRGDEPWPSTLQIGIGLNAGPCCVGNMGSAQRLAYSLIGDTVNLASRIEGLTKFYGIPIAIGSALRAQLPAFATVPVDLVRVVGRDAPEEIAALVGDESVAASPQFQQFAASHNAMLAAYRELNFKIAAQWLDEIEQPAKDFGLGKVHALYRERVTKLELDPPSAGWDGVFAATEK
jgi:adenylate cyclase